MVAGVYWRDLLTGKCNYFFHVVDDSPSHCFELCIVFRRVHYPGQGFCFTQVQLIPLLCESQLFHLLGFFGSLFLDDSLQPDRRVDRDSFSHPKAKPECSHSSTECASLCSVSTPGPFWALLGNPMVVPGGTTRLDPGESMAGTCLALFWVIWALIQRWKCLPVPEWSRCSWMLADAPYQLAHCPPLPQTTNSTEHGAAKASVASATAMQSPSARQESGVIFLTGAPPLFLVRLIKHSVRTVLLRRGAALDEKCFSLS